jgi:hypothetical protein
MHAIIAAFLPAAIVGLLTHHWITAQLDRGAERRRRFWHRRRGRAIFPP